MGKIERVSSWASFIVAFIALVQVWLIAIWRRFFRAGTLDIFETGALEVGFGNLGPSIGMHGTFRAVHRDQFVREAVLLVTRERDGASHKFVWTLFRSSGPDGAVMELPAGFLVAAAQPHRYNIFFSDAETRRELDGALLPVRAAWNVAFAAAAQDNAEVSGEQVFNEGFQTEASYLTAFGDLQRAMYWSAGTYSLQLSATTSRPTRNFNRAWRFTLTEDDLRALQLNVIPTLRATLGLEGTYLFAYPAYQESPPAAT